MSRDTHPKAITANDLLEGDVVYLDGDGGWTRHLSRAALFDTGDALEPALQAARARPDMVVGIYATDMARGPDGTPRPVHFRETFRATGPSNYAHGKQEAQADV